jgi:hypothetical protein
LCAILESHVDISKLFKICKNVFKKWEWTSNGNVCDKGARIILGWDADILDVVVLCQMDQVMNVQLIFKLTKKVLLCSIVYAANNYISRRVLWNDLGKFMAVVRSDPWVILGDFNCTLSLEDKLCSSSSIDVAMREFKACVEYIEVEDVNGVGLHYTWTQKPKNCVGILRKLDRVMANLPFHDIFPGTCAIFQPYRVSDHSPCVLKIPMQIPRK